MWKQLNPALLPLNNVLKYVASYYIRFGPNVVKQEFGQTKLGARAKSTPYRSTRSTKTISSCSATFEGTRNERLYSSDYNEQLVFDRTD